MLIQEHLVEDIIMQQVLILLLQVDITIHLVLVFLLLQVVEIIQPVVMLHL